ncbi:hypothetical protein KIPB_010998, partial [Kipferlia bialata]
IDRDEDDQTEMAAGVQGEFDRVRETLDEVHAAVAESVRAVTAVETHVNSAVVGRLDGVDDKLLNLDASIEAVHDSQDVFEARQSTDFDKLREEIDSSAKAIEARVMHILTKDPQHARLSESRFFSVESAVKAMQDSIARTAAEVALVKAEGPPR